MKKDFLYRTAETIWTQLIKKDKSGRWYSKQVKENLEKLFPFEGQEREQEHYVKKIRLSLFLGLAGLFAAAGMCVSEHLQPPVKGNEIARQDYGGAAENVPLEVLVDGGERYQFDLEISGRVYSKEQLEKLCEDAEKELERAILGENESLEHVERDLTLVTELSGYPFEITWESGDYSVIDGEGKLQTADISKEGEQVGLNAVFTCEDFRAEYLFHVQIYPETMTGKEIQKQNIFEAVKKAEKESREEETVLLPSEIQGKKLTWRSGRKPTWTSILPGAVCAALLVYFLRDEELKKEVKKREKQLVLTYPEMVSKLSIYLGAGMTLKTAWEKICADYVKGKTERGKNSVYEEMNIACQEMRSGLSEAAAYERFGRRCGIQLYSKFSTLLTQNLRKGSVKLGPLLKEESRIAFEERKNAAKKAGEEAGTKLLLPMMMMLCVVMVMILLPAFMTF